MSFIVGIHDLQAAEDEIERRLEKQLESLYLTFGTGKTIRFVVDGLGFALVEHGILQNGEQPATSDDGRYVLALDGEIFNCDELRCTLNVDSDRRMMAPRLLLEVLLRNGASSSTRLNGQFCVVLYDSHERRLRLINDRFGFRPLFFVQRSGTLIFASTLGALRAADPSTVRVDSLGTLELFCYGTQIDRRSWIQDYQRLPPCTVMTIDKNGVRREKYWTYCYDESSRGLDQATYFTVFARLLDRAVERRMSGSQRVGIFLSGGYDSRAVAGAIRKEHLPIPAFTFGVPESRDARFAALLADRLGFEHHLLTSHGPHLYPHCASIVRRNEGLIPFAQNTSIAFHTAIKERADVILTGFLGEYSGSHTWPALLRVRSRRKAISTIFERMLGGRTAVCRRVFRKKFFDETFPRLRSEFAGGFEALPNENPLNLADAWDFTYRHPWSYQAAAVDRPVLEVRAPQLDVELVDFLLTVPWYARLEQRVYKKMIAYSYPSIRDVPCTNSARPIDPHFAREYLKMSLRYVGRKAWEPIRAAFGRRPGLGREISDLAEEFRTEPQLVDELLEPMLADGVFEPSIFDVEEIRALAAEHYDRRARHEATLTLLISWGLASRWLIHGESLMPREDAHEDG